MANYVCSMNGWMINGNDVYVNYYYSLERQDDQYPTIPLIKSSQPSGASFSSATAYAITHAVCSSTIFDK